MKSLTKNIYIFAIVLMLPLEALSMDLPQNVKQSLDQATIAEDDMITGPPGCTDTLFNYMRANWRSVLNNLDEIAPTDNQKIIITRACGALDAEQYLDYLETIRDLRISGKIDSQVFEDALSNENDLKGGFLSVNYQNPKVRTFVKSLEGLIPSKSIDDILSGKDEKDYEIILESEGNQIDTSLLLPTSTSGTTNSPQSVAPSPTIKSSDIPSQPTPASQAQTEYRRSLFYCAIIALIIVIILIAVVLRRKSLKEKGSATK